VYAVPMLAFVLAPNRVRAPVRATAAGLASVAVPIVFVAGLLTGTGEAAGAAPPGARPVAVAVTDAGCEPAVLRLPAGRASFTVTGRSDRVSEYEVLAGERVLGEAENLAPGITGHFSLTLKPGRYRLECPGGADGSLVVR
jgi:iron uptake system component EfeO